MFNSHWCSKWDNFLVSGLELMQRPPWDPTGSRLTQVGVFIIRKPKRNKIVQTKCEILNFSSLSIWLKVDLPVVFGPHINRLLIGVATFPFLAKVTWRGTVNINVTPQSTRESNIKHTRKSSFLQILGYIYTDLWITVTGIWNMWIYLWWYAWNVKKLFAVAQYFYPPKKFGIYCNKI